MIRWERPNGDIVEVIEDGGYIRDRNRKRLAEYSGEFYRDDGQALIIAADGKIVGERSGQAAGAHSQL